MAEGRKTFRTKEIINSSLPLLEANRASIASIERRTFQYGSTDRHQLDIYYPPPDSAHPLGHETTKPDAIDLDTHQQESSRQYPIIVFLYGGGLTRGSRCEPLESTPETPPGLVYNNVGAYFARRGFLVVIPDYRLAPNITFPQGSEDVRDAIEWVLKRTEAKGQVEDSDSGVQFPGNADEVFVLAHSAGGLHLAGYLLSPSLSLPPFTDIPPRMRGVIFLGVPFTICQERREFFEVAKGYYGGGDAKRLRETEPLGILAQFEEKDLAKWLPPVLNLRAQSEPKQIAKGVSAFTKALNRKGATVVEGVLEGHDHMSPILALSSGSGEQWAEDVIEWMRSRSIAVTARTVDGELPQPLDPMIFPPH